MRLLCSASYSPPNNKCATIWEMGKRQTTTIDALFGSKTRVKLLHLFLNNPGKSFYVREITRLIDEQINSVRRELSNMLNVNVITSDTADHKLYYEVNPQYEYYQPFRMIFADVEPSKDKKVSAVTESTDASWKPILSGLKGVRVMVAAGILVEGSASSVDLLVVGSTSSQKIKAAVKALEKHEGREVNYTSMSYDEFYYRLSVRDRFITEILSGKRDILVDAENIVKN